MCGYAWEKATGKVAFLREWGVGAPDDMVGKSRELMKAVRYFIEELARMIGLRVKDKWSGMLGKISARKNRGINDVIFWQIVFVLAAICYGVGQPLMNGEFGFWSAIWDGMLVMWVIKIFCKVKENERRETRYDRGRREP